MPLLPLRASPSLAATAVFALAAITAHAQNLPAANSNQPASTSASATTNGEGPAGIVPFTRGFNLSLIAAAEHDSSAGWDSTFTPNIAWRFDPHFSISAEIPIYDYIVTSRRLQTKNPAGVVTAETTTYRTQHHALGDTTINGEYETKIPFADYTLSATLGLPTGDTKDGLGAGSVTYSLNNHFEHELLDWLTPNLELGIGNNPDLNNTRLARSYQDVGESAYFQVGFEINPWKYLDFETDAYESLPIGSQNVTSATVKGKKGKQTQTATSSGDGEDNGSYNTLDIPLTRHITLSGFYNRSLRDHDDTVGFSLTFLLRAKPEEATHKH